MKNTFKLALASLAIAGIISATPLFSANATDAKPAAVVELQDGTKVKIEGENVFVVAADGTATPAPDGAHVTKDGQTINTKDGKIAN